MRLPSSGAIHFSHIARGVRLFFTHDAGCAIARVARDAKGRFSTTDERAELIGEAA
jgi:hypothetical protein